MTRPYVLSENPSPVLEAEVGIRTLGEITVDPRLLTYFSGEEASNFLSDKLFSRFSTIDRFSLRMGKSSFREVYDSLRLF